MSCGHMQLTRLGLFALVIPATCSAQSLSQPALAISLGATSQAAETAIRRQVSEMTPQGREQVAKSLAQRAAVYDERLISIQKDAARALADKDNYKADALLANAESIRQSFQSVNDLLDYITAKTENLPRPDRSLEQLIRETNPALPICGRSVSWRGDTVLWQSAIDRYSTTYGWVSEAVARVEQISYSYRMVEGKPAKIPIFEPIGTAFLVSPTRLVTAYHVVQNRYDEITGMPIPGRELRLNFGAEYKCQGTDNALITPVKAIPLNLLDKSHDIAVLEIAEINARRPLELAAPKDLVLEETIFVVGFPGLDQAVDRDLLLSVMRVDAAGNAVFDVKRFEPGGIASVCSQLEDFELGHNATTFGNSSGSPIVRMKDGMVIGVQRAGLTKVCNYATRSEFVLTLLKPPLDVGRALGSTTVGAAVKPTKGDEIKSREVSVTSSERSVPKLESTIASAAKSAKIDEVKRRDEAVPSAAQTITKYRLTESDEEKLIALAGAFQPHGNLRPRSLVIVGEARDPETMMALSSGRVDRSAATTAVEAKIAFVADYFRSKGAPLALISTKAILAGERLPDKPPVRMPERKGDVVYVWLDADDTTSPNTDHKVPVAVAPY